MHDHSYDDILTFEKCIAFLDHLGIRTEFRDIGTNSFLPGFLIENGIIVIDYQQLRHPGDILHEAGHIAVVPSADRRCLTEEAIMHRVNREAEEIMAIAWSYAACSYLLIDPAFVFHEEGYRGGSSYITDSCDDKSYLGLSMLEGIGLTDVPSYPDMIRWLRE